MSDSEPPPSRAKGIQSVELGFLLLEPFIAAPGPFTLKHLAAAAGMGPAKAHFYLTSLMRVGLVRRAPGGGYALGPAALRLGLAAMAQVDVLAACEAALPALRDALGCGVFASVWTGAGATVVHQAQAAQGQAWHMAVGAALPPLTATGRAFLAYAPPAEQRRIIAAALAAAQPGEPWFGATEAAMLALCADIRAGGLSPGSGAVVPGFISLAAPVLDHAGNAAAAITVIGAARDFDARPDGPNAIALLDAASRIAAELGFSRPRAP